MARQSAADSTAATNQTPESISLARTESGGPDDEDSAPDGLVSRASGRPDHPRTLEEIKSSGYIRVLTRNNDTSFFIHRGHRMGFDYELGKKLAHRLGIRVDMAAYLLKLSDRRYASKTRFGFCRGIEPVDYVRHIDERYAGYAQLVPLARAGER